jgi:hypothetical protein
MKVGIINSIVWWGGLLGFFSWHNSAYPEAGFFSVFVTIEFWGLVVALSLIQWIIKKFFSRPASPQQ